MFCLDASGKLLQVGRWNTLLSVLPINICVELEEPLEEDPLEELPEDELPEDPEPPLTELPPGNVNVDPLVEKTTFPLRSVRYTVTPALESLVNVSEVG